MNQDIEVPRLNCFRCGHIWIPRKHGNPKQCPKCHSPYWNKPKSKGVGKTRISDKYYLDYLLTIGSIHRMKHNSFELLSRVTDEYLNQKLINGIELDEPQEQSIRYDKLLMQLQIIQVACQYIELLGSYSCACLKTGLLYPPLVYDIGSTEINNFYQSIKKIKDDDLRLIFNPNYSLSNDELDDIKKCYLRVSDFKSRYWSLYNAIKHGNRVYTLEIKTTDGKGQSTGDTYIHIQWVDVKESLKDQEKVLMHTWDNRQITIPIYKRRNPDMLLPINLDEYRDIVNDCFTIIELILEKNTPDYIRKRVASD